MTHSVSDASSTPCALRERARPRPAGAQTEIIAFSDRMKDFEAEGVAARSPAGKRDAGS